jgi:HK97 family phage portal protein
MTYNSLPAWFEQLRRGGRIATTADAYSVSPLLYRATNLRADALSSVPYRLTYQGEDAEWPFVQNPAQLIKDIERALCLTGGAYLYKIYKGKRLTGFVPLNPTTMNVALMTDKATLENPLLGASFVQTVNGKSYGPWSIADVVYFREPSYLDDIGPGIAPAHVALANAKLEHYLSRFASAFFEGGAQPVTIMNLPEHMDEAEFQRFRTEMRSTIGGGIINAFKMIFMRAPDIKIEQLTPPINTMQMPELYERVITSVGMAYGVPRTMLEASAANYATAESDRQSFWRETVIPRLSMYEAVLNAQVFAPLGWKISFQPEMMDVMQVDEASRAGSLLQLVQAGVPLRGAMTILGYDGIDEALGAVPAAPALPEPPPDTPPDEVIAPPDNVAKRAEHWELLAKKLERRIKAGKSAVCSFESDAISQDEVKSVMARITPHITVHEARHIVDEVKAVDDMTDDERRIYDKLVDEFRKRGEAWVRKILRNENVDPTLADIVAPVLNAELSRVAQAQIDTIGNDIGVPATDAAQDRVVDWLVDYVPMETRLIDATTAERIKKVIDVYRQTSGMTSQDVADMIRPSVDPARALMIARTETVRAQTQANVIYQGYLRERGLNYERTWITERDDITCPICGPLDGTPESTWPADVAGGPPGHPNCRCSTALRLVKS